MTVPTGQCTQGNPSPVITPTIACGKGIGRFDVPGTLRISPPLGHEQATGRNLTWNDTFQYNIFKKIWPETEVNFIYYHQDEHNGDAVVYFTPGLGLGRFHVWDHLSFTVGGAYEIAVT